MYDSEPRSVDVADMLRDEALGKAILDGSETLASLEAKVAAGEIDPRPVSGRQEARSGTCPVGHRVGLDCAKRPQRFGKSAMVQACSIHRSPAASQLPGHSAARSTSSRSTHPFTMQRPACLCHASFDPA